MQRLSRKAFAVVDAVYLEAHGATRTWLEGRRWQDRPGYEEVAAQLREITAASRSTAEVVVRLRAAQAAYFVNGVLVQVDDVGLRGQPDVPAVGLTPPMSARLRRLVTPAWACALALGVAGGFSAATLARLKIADVAAGGEALRVTGTCIDVPSHAAGLVRSQLLARSDAGAGGGDPLLVQADGPFQAALLRRRLETAARLAGMWRPSEEQRPPWHPRPVEGYTINLVPLDSNWDGPTGP